MPHAAADDDLKQATQSPKDTATKDKSSKTSHRRLSSRVTEELLDVNARYLIDEAELGHGHYGTVRKCVDRLTGEKFAIKTIKKGKVGRLELLKREIEILRTVNHPAIIKLIDVYEDANNLHLVTELCLGGELFDRIIAKTESPEGHYSEKQAAALVHKILSAIDYIHNEHNICHRDLKPENFLFKDKDSDDGLKIIDFGLSRFEDQYTAMTTRVGTPYYISPEVLDKKYTKACDLWSIGIVLYILLCGFPPFYGENDNEIFRAIQKGDFKFPSPEWDGISEEAKDLISKLLKKDPSKRISASAALVHEWFDKVMDVEDSRKNFTANTSRMHHRLKRFVGAGNLKKMALNIIASNLAEEDIGHLRKLFHSIDIDGNGVITLEELQKVIAAEGLIELQSEVLAVMQGIDMDGNQTLDWREFLAASMERSVFLRESYMRKAFDYFDPTGRGTINIDDLTRCFGSDEEARKILGDVDIDGNGVITWEEFLLMMKRL